MTIREIADTAGCNEKTVRRIVSEKFPGKIVNGKVTRFSWEEAHVLMKVLPKKNQVDLGHDLGQMSEAASGSTLSSRDLDMSTPLTLVEAVKRHVERYAAETGKKIPAVWDTLYGRFEYETNTNYRRLAYVNGSTNLDMIEEMGAMAALLNCAQTHLKLKTPALPEKEKAPVQGSLLEGEQDADANARTHEQYTRL